ncbi:MAG TPA: hypothetical protein PLV09_01400 [Candidatus Omnitrophota bacterium]|nr:hypothetical protein [Candidatus Omnitrophota bacterium]HPN66056.1 hypothetical protein [Candidatus Omnitrophota bacterium]HRZ67407.1 hypothetical protein [Candidatus Omnitrophota bacterium]
MEEEKARIEARVRREMMQLFIEEARIEAEAKERHEKFLKDKEDERQLRSGIVPGGGGLEINVASMKARMRLEERIKLEKLRGKRILQGALISSAVILAAVLMFMAQQKEPAVFYDLAAIKDSLKKASAYHGQFKVDEVFLSRNAPSAVIELSFLPSTEKDLKDFVEGLVKKYSMMRPGEKINIILKAKKRIYATVSYIPRGNSIEIELMK